MTNSPPPSDKDILEARRNLWKRGVLHWKLDSTQKELYNFIKKAPKRTVVVNCSRRIGKSYVLLILALEQCLQRQRSIVTFLQPEQKMIKRNIRPLMDKIFGDAPREMRPKYNTQDTTYRFFNGSELVLAGTDNGNEEKLRGGDSHLAIVDEAAFCKSDLDYIVKTILIPTTTLTEGKIILSSSSPTSTEHDYYKFMQQAVLQECFIKKTIDDAVADSSNDRITQYILDEIIAQYEGGRENSDFRREYLCEVSVDADKVVIPEFTEIIEKEICIEWPRPPFCDKYVGMDIGFSDLTVALFAYYDFVNAVLVIEDEVVMNGPKMTTPALANNIIKTEERLWTDKITGEFVAPYKRVADNNLILLNDLYRNHNILFFPTKKDNKDAALNEVRVAIAAKQIIINPRCKTLINHIKYGTWNKSRTDFARGADGSHADGIAALMYLHRNIEKNRNPFPRGYKYQHLKNKSAQDVFLREDYAKSYESLKKQTETDQQVFKSLFKAWGSRR